MKRAVVTGGTGFIGMHLVEKLLKENIEVFAVCRKESPNLSRLPNDVYIVFDYEKLPAADVFYHIAWEGATGAGRVNALLQSKNITDCLIALETAKKVGARFIGLGTVYERFAENACFKSLNPYILAKHSAHILSSQYAHILDCDYTWCQICNAIGRYIKPEQIFAYTVSCLLSGTPAEFGSAGTYFDVVSVEDVAQGLFLLGIKKPIQRIYYIGSTNPMLLREYIEKARIILDSNTALFFGKRPDDGLYLDKNWLDIEPLIRDTGFMPSLSFEQAIKNTVEYVKEKI